MFKRGSLSCEGNTPLVNPEAGIWVNVQNSMEDLVVLKANSTASIHLCQRHGMQGEKALDM